MMDALKWIAAAIAATLYVAQVDGAAALDNVRPAADDAAATAPVSAEPRETSATFGDWVARCQRIGAAGAEKSVCEAAQTLVIKGQQAPIAQIAFGRSEGGSVAATVLLPINIALAYVLCQPFPTFALIGPRLLSETRTSFQALDVQLTLDELKWLNLEDEKA